MSSDISQILNQELPERHSYFQLKYFVIGKEPTLQGQLWQCVREINARQDSLKSMKLELEETKDNLELLNIEIQQIQSHVSQLEKLTKRTVDQELNRQQLTIQKRKLHRKVAATDERIIELNKKEKFKQEELTFFTNSYESLTKLEPMKPFDDLESQTDYWSEKLSQKINMANLLGRPLDTEMLETVLALPDNAPIKVQTINMIEAQQQSLIAKQELEKQESDKEQ